MLGFEIKSSYGLDEGDIALLSSLRTTILHLDESSDYVYFYNLFPRSLRYPKHLSQVSRSVAAFPTEIHNQIVQSLEHNFLCRNNLHLYIFLLNIEKKKLLPDISSWSGIPLEMIDEIIGRMQKIEEIHKKIYTSLDSEEQKCYDLIVMIDKLNSLSTVFDKYLDYRYVNGYNEFCKNVSDTRFEYFISCLRPLFDEKIIKINEIFNIITNPKFTIITKYVPNNRYNDIFGNFNPILVFSLILKLMKRSEDPSVPSQDKIDFEFLKTSLIQILKPKLKESFMFSLPEPDPENPEPDPENPEQDPENLSHITNFNTFLENFDIALENLKKTDTWEQYKTNPKI